ncbi:hypothetical protein ES703_46410 [subsurface metagenome]
MQNIVLLILRKNTGNGVITTYRTGWDMPAFDYRQALELRDALGKHSVRYLFIGKSGAVILGFPDTTQDVDIFVEKSLKNCKALVMGLMELRFQLSESQKNDILKGKDFIQLKKGPFDLDLIFAPDGIETFEDAWHRHINVEGFPVCHIDDIIASKAAAKRKRDLESLPRLKAFREYWITHRNKS